VGEANQTASPAAVAAITASSPACAQRDRRVNFICHMVNSVNDGKTFFTTLAIAAGQRPGM
jgi:hypothetical protein